MIPTILVILLVVGLLLYEIMWRPIACERKIKERIESMGGTVGTIEKLTPRDEIFNVYYKVNGESMHSVVKFDFFYEEEWK
jgi:hypothetical protein